LYYDKKTGDVKVVAKEKKEVKKTNISSFQEL